MIRAAWKSLLVVAVLLMPFGMTPAAATAAHHHGASMPMQHCPEQGSNHGAKGAFAECTMACSAALPAAEIVRDTPPLTISLPTELMVAQALHGLHPDTATPPPKTF
jgi:hypothetical protein